MCEMFTVVTWKLNKSCPSKLGKLYRVPLRLLYVLVSVNSVLLNKQAKWEFRGS